MTRGTITFERLKAILAGYGARADAWPEAERAAAVALIEASADAKHMLEAAVAVDQLLNSLPKPRPADDTYLKRLNEIPSTSGHQTRGATSGIGVGSGQASWGAALRWLRPTGFAFQTTGLAAAGILGLMLGFSNFSIGPEPIEHIDASAYLFENPSILADMKNVD